MVRKINGLQKKALTLYKQFIQMSYTKPLPNQAKFRLYSHQLFYDNFHKINRKDFTTIEHLLRFGEKKLELLKNDSVKNINL